MARRDYAGPGLVIHWDSDLCTHSSRCWRNLPEVFQPWNRPWIVPSGADADRTRRVIELCPSGAISYSNVAVEAADGWKEACPPELQAEVDAAAARWLAAARAKALLRHGTNGLPDPGAGPEA